MRRAAHVWSLTQTACEESVPLTQHARVAQRPEQLTRAQCSHRTWELLRLGLSLLPVSEWSKAAGGSPQAAPVMGSDVQCFNKEYDEGSL